MSHKVTFNIADSNANVLGCDELAGEFNLGETERIDPIDASLLDAGAGTLAVAWLNYLKQRNQSEEFQFQPTGDGPVDDAVEIQELDLDSPAGGTFKLGDGTSWTADIAHDASPADIETALEGLYGAGKVNVASLADWTPSDITTALWLDSADADTLTLDASDNVEQWDDKSGNDRHAVQTNSAARPPYVSGANPRISFDGSAHFLDIPDSGGATSTVMFAIIVLRSPSVAQNVYAGLLCKGTHNSSGWEVGYNSSASVYFIASDGVSLNLDENVGHSIMGTSMDASGSSIYRNGTLAVSSDLALVSSSDEIQICNRRHHSDRKCKVDIEEILLMSSLPAEADRQKLEGYLAHKWGLTDNLPSNHLYKADKPISSIFGPFRITFAHSVGNSGLVADFTGLT